MASALRSDCCFWEEVLGVPLLRFFLEQEQIKLKHKIAVTPQFSNSGDSPFSVRSSLPHEPVQDLKTVIVAYVLRHGFIAYWLVFDLLSFLLLPYWVIDQKPSKSLLLPQVTEK